MPSTLDIGLMRLDPGWRLLLRQIGCSFHEIDWDRTTPESSAVFILNAHVDARHANRLEELLAAGAAVLDASNFLLRTLPSRNFTARYYDALIPTSDEPTFHDVRIVDLHRLIHTYHAAQHVGNTVFMGNFHKGHFVHLPFDIGRLMLDERRERKRFYSPSGRYPDELVAAVSKGELRKIVVRSLRWLFERRGLPSVFLERTPDLHHVPFCFRIDSDYGSESQIRAMRRVARRHGIHPTWFVHAEPQQKFLGCYREFADDGDEIGIHAWRHRTFRDYVENSANINAADAALRSVGIAARSFASPTGRWSPGLDRALNEFGFDYSSEFGLDYDDLPFYPCTGGRFSNVLQLPIHPISIGTMIRAHMTPSQMIDYYRAVIDEKIAHHEPVLLYGHPGHGHLDVLDAVFAYVNSRNLMKTTMGEFAAWWKHRSAIRFGATYEGDAVVINGDGIPDDIGFIVYRSDGAQGVVHGAGRHTLDSIEWRTTFAEPIPAPSDLRRTRRLSLRTLAHTIEDFNATVRQ